MTQSSKRISLLPILGMVIALVLCVSAFSFSAFAEENSVRGFVNDATFYYSEDAFDFSRLSAQIVGADASSVGFSVTDAAGQEYGTGEVLPVGIYSVHAKDSDGQPLSGVAPGKLSIVKNPLFDFASLSLSDASFDYAFGQGRTLTVSGLPVSVDVLTEYADVSSSGQIGAYAPDPNGKILPGVYSVRVTVTSDCYEIPGGKAVYTAKMTVRALNADLSGFNFVNRTATYTGLSLADVMAAHVTLSDPFTVSYSYADQNGDPIAADDIVPVGTYTVTAHFTMKEGYSQISDRSAVLTVAPADYDTASHPLPFADTTVVYQPGADNRIEGFDAVLADFPDYSIEYSANGVSVETVTDAGEYIATVRLSPNYNPLFYTLTVLPCPIAPSVIFEDASVEFDGEAHSAFITELPEHITSVSYVFRKESATVSSCVDAGVYTITAVFVAEKNYVLADGYSYPTATLTVNRAPISAGEIDINFANGDCYVPGTARMLYVSGHSAMGYQLIPSEVTAVDAHGDPIALTDIIYPGDYAVTFSFVPDKNHYGDPYSQVFAFTVLPAALPIAGDLLTGGSFVYSGTALSTDQLFDGIEGIEDCVLSDLEMLNEDGEWMAVSAPEHVGRYRMKALITPAAYYRLPEGISATEPTVYEFSVVPMTVAPSGFTVEDLEVEFGTAEPQFTVSGEVPAWITGFKYRYEKDGVIIADLAHAPIGEYAVTAFPVLSADYVLSPDYVCPTANLTVVKKAISPVVSLQPVSFDYSGKPIVYSLGQLPEFVTEARITYKKGGSAVASVVTAGVYVASVEFVTDANHTIASGYTCPTVQITVLPVKGNFDGVTFIDKSVTFDPGVKPDIKLSKVPTGYTVTYDTEGAFHAGTYTVTAAFTPDENHLPADPMTAKLTIVPKEYKVTSFTFNNKEAFAIFGAKTIKINGVPKDVTITYFATDENGVSVDPDRITKAGIYKFYATVTPDSTDYSATVLTATLTLKSPIGFFIAFIVLLVLAVIVYLLYLFFRKHPDSPDDRHYTDSPLADREAAESAAKYAEDKKKIKFITRMKKLLLPQLYEKKQEEKAEKESLLTRIGSFFQKLFTSTPKKEKTPGKKEKKVSPKRPKPEKVKKVKAEKPKKEKAEKPKANAPKTEAPKPDEEKEEHPVSDAPMAEEPKAEETTAEESKAEEPKPEETEAPEPSEPVSEEPKVVEPSDESFDENAPLIIEIPATEARFIDGNTAVADAGTTPSASAPTVEAVDESTEISEKDRPDESSVQELAETAEPAADANVGFVPIVVASPEGFAHYRTSFMSRLIQADDEIKGYYSVAKNALMRYEGVKARTSWNFESFNSGRVQLAKLNVKGRVLQVCLALDPKEYSAEKYHFSDVSDKPKLGDVPMMLKVKSDRGLKYALELIDELMQKNGLPAGEEQNVDYRMPYESDEELLAKDLIKVTYSEEARP